MDAKIISGQPKWLTADLLNGNNHYGTGVSVGSTAAVCACCVCISE